MTTIRHELTARCAPERLWAELADLEAVAVYNPTVRSARVRGAQRTGVGAERECELAPSGRVVERVHVWEEGRAVGLELVEHAWPVRSMRWVTRVEAALSGSRLTQDLEYQPRFGPMGWLLDRLVMERQLRTTLDRVLTALVARAETNTPIADSIES